MAADAINVSETTYLTGVRYYIANLGTTMESQVRSSVFPTFSVYPFVYPLGLCVLPYSFVFACLSCLIILSSCLYQIHQLLPFVPAPCCVPRRLTRLNRQDLDANEPWLSIPFDRIRFVSRSCLLGP